MTARMFLRFSPIVTSLAILSCMQFAVACNLDFEPGALVRREPMISGVVESTRLTTQLSVSVPSMGRRSS